MEIEGMYVPVVYDEFSTRRVLVTEYIGGSTLNDVLNRLDDPD